MRLRLLADIREVFAKRPGDRAVFTTVLITELCQMDEAPWEGYYKRGLEARDLASLLRPYKVRSTTVNVRGERAKGYRRDSLQEPWNRYLDGIRD